MTHPARTLYYLTKIFCWTRSNRKCGASAPIEPGDSSHDSETIAVILNCRDREVCLAGGMDDHMAKPVHIDALVEALMRVRPRSVT